MMLDSRSWVSPVLEKFLFGGATPLLILFPPCVSIPAPKLSADSRGWEVLLPAGISEVLCLPGAADPRLRSTAFITIWMPEMKFTPKISNGLPSTMLIHHEILSCRQESCAVPLGTDTGTAGCREAPQGLRAGHTPSSLPRPLLHQTPQNSPSESQGSRNR